MFISNPFPLDLEIVSAQRYSLRLHTHTHTHTQVNGCLPDRIIVFRDGVGDGQMHTVSQYEVPQMNSCFSTFGSDYTPKFGVVVVQKRISTRIFSRAGSKGLVNPPPGTIVDHMITRKGW